MKHICRDTVTAFRNNYTHPANYTSLLNPSGLEVSMTAFHCRQFLLAAMTRLRVMEGRLPAHAQHSQHVPVQSCSCSCHCCTLQKQPACHRCIQLAH